MYRYCTKERKKKTHKKCRKSQKHQTEQEKNSVYQSKLKEGEKYKNHRFWTFNIK